MAKGRHAEVIEIPTEQLSYVPGRHADRSAMLGRLSEAWRGAVALAPPTAVAPPTALVERLPSVIGAGGATFRRMIEVPGCRLAVVLGAWWQQAEHGDGHLRLGVPCPVWDAWSLSGAFRRRLISRWLPVELLLSPYLGRWTLLELMPRRAIRPNRVYFRAGHRSLDWFVAAIRAQVVLAENGQDGASRPGTEGRIGEADVVRLQSTTGSLRPSTRS